MDTPPLSAIALAVVLAALVHAAVVGEKVHGATGAISILGVAVTLLGLTIGWLLERFVPITPGVDDWVNYRNLRIEVTVLFLLVALFSLLVVNVIRRDLAGQSKRDPWARKCGFLATLFVLAVALAARGKLVAGVVLLLARSNP